MTLAPGAAAAAVPLPATLPPPPEPVAAAAWAETLWFLLLGLPAGAELEMAPGGRQQPSPFSLGVLAVLLVLLAGSWQAKSSRGAAAETPP